MKRRKNDAAVSPVAGVMLMLVVTIIIAAVVSSFAGGLLTTTEKAPTAVLSATVYTTWTDGYGSNNGTIFISNINGDTIDLTKLAVKVYNATTSYTYSPLDQGYASETKLESGETLNAVYATGKDDYLDGVITISTGEYVEVMVVYDDQQVLYDEEVVAL